jgi:hypothetical protein
MPTCSPREKSPPSSRERYHSGVTPQAWLTLAAILAGPMSVFWLQRWREKARDIRSRKMWVFRELMVTRGARLSQRHVEALNSIEVEFYDHRKVLEAWKKYFDYFETGNRGPCTDAELTARLERGQDLLVALLYQMAEVLNYHFDEVALKRNIYVPIAHGEVDTELNVIRKGFFEVFSGQKQFPIELHIPAEVLQTLQVAGQKQVTVPDSPPKLTA